MQSFRIQGVSGCRILECRVSDLAQGLRASCGLRLGFSI